MHISDVILPKSSSGKRASGPMLLFISESGIGKRVPLSSFRLSPLNRIGLIGFKVYLKMSCMRFPSTFALCNTNSLMYMFSSPLKIGLRPFL